MKKIRWIIGTITIVGTLILFIFIPHSILLYQKLPYIGLYRYGLLLSLLCTALCLYRLWKGPTPSDRIVVLDIFGIIIVGYCAIVSIPTGRTWYIDIAIAWALQSFIGTLALAKYLEGKGFDE